jgi:hypothetical protein
MDYAAEALNIGDLYQQIARQMSSFLQWYIRQPNPDKVFVGHFVDDQSRILSYSNTFYSLADKIAFADDEVYFAKVDLATAVINDNIKTIHTTDKWINFAGAVISLGASIATGSGSGILASVETILATFNVSISSASS